MKLYLYSGFSSDNPLDKHLSNSIQQLTYKTLTIFPSNSDNFKSKYIPSISEYFRNLGFIQIQVCLYSQDISENKESNQTEQISQIMQYQNELPDIKFVNVHEAFQSDAIFLTGGDIYYFLNSLQQNSLLEKIQKFALEKDKLLIGLSAGSMLMQKDISNAIIPSYDPEPNTIGNFPLESLNLFKGYFFPHFDGDSRYIAEVQEFANLKQVICYISRDNQGLYIDENDVHLYRDVLVVEPTI